MSCCLCSLRVNLDMGKVVYSWMIQRDKNIPETVVRSTTIPEELGRIQYLLSDKTGTLTQNEMVHCLRTFSMQWSSNCVCVFVCLLYMTIYLFHTLLLESLLYSRPILGAGPSLGVELFQVFMRTGLWQVGAD